ncbi:restriction endonuclease, partial [human gut metagenome]
EHEVALYWIKRNRRCIGYISRESVKKNVLDISRPKVFIPEAYGAGESFPHQIIGIPEIASADSACSQSYLYVAFGTKTEVENFAKYLHTKFLRVLVSASKVSQHAMSKVYRFVPVENFTAYSDIDWSKSIPEIDTQLYAKYGLTAEEIDFIESMIKPME